MALLSTLRRYLAPTLRLTRFMVVWTTITLVLWLLALPVIAREVFKGLMRRNTGRRTQTPWAQQQTRDSTTADSRSYRRNSSYANGQSNTGARNGDGEPRFSASRQSSYASYSSHSSAGRWSGSSSEHSTSPHDSGSDLDSPPMSRPSSRLYRSFATTKERTPFFGATTGKLRPGTTSPPRARTSTQASGQVPTPRHV